jgi:hypothetical protein
VCYSCVQNFVHVCFYISHRHKKIYLTNKTRECNFSQLIKYYAHYCCCRRLTPIKGRGAFLCHCGHDCYVPCPIYTLFTWSDIRVLSPIHAQSVPCNLFTFTRVHETRVIPQRWHENMNVQKEYINGYFSILCDLFSCFGNFVTRKPFSGNGIFDLSYSCLLFSLSIYKLPRD